MVYEGKWVAACETFESNTTGSGRIIAVSGKKCIAQFDETGYTTVAEKYNVLNGKIKDPYAITCYGVGYLGEFKKTIYWKQAKQLWQNMLKRCYSEKDPRGYFGRSFVDSRWLCFSNFNDDLPNLVNFKEWFEGKSKYNLDKDSLVQGNKIYSKSTCMFLTEFENKSLGGINRHKTK